MSPLSENYQVADCRTDVPEAAHMHPYSLPVSLGFPHVLSLGREGAMARRRKTFLRSLKQPQRAVPCTASGKYHGRRRRRRVAATKRGW